MIFRIKRSYFEVF